MRQVVSTIAVAAGGTAGHLFPAEALASCLVVRGHRVVLLTDARTDGRWFEGRERFVIAGAGIVGRGLVRGGRAAAGMALGVAQSLRILSRLNARALVGFGGYPSVAPVLAARLLRRRPAIVLHEQNAVLGRANRALARRADVLASSFAHTAHAGAATLTGNPVRGAIAHVPYRPGWRILVLGGSLGARVMSDVVPPALAALPDGMRARITVTQQCRAEDVARVRDAYAAAGIVATLAPFFDDMPALLTEASLVIARAGASTVAELAVAGRPAILVPLPHAIDDHQAANARAMGEAGAAWVVAQPDFTPAALAALLSRTADAWPQAAAAALALARPRAADALADLVEHAMTEQVR